MLVLPEDILFKHATANNVSDRKPFCQFLIIKWEGFSPLIDLIGLITFADFNQLLIDFRISADSQP